MLDFGELYKSLTKDVKYPNKKDYKKACNCGCPNCKHIVFDEEAYKKDRAEYEEKTALASQKVKSSMLEDLGLENHPCKDLIYAKACEEGHAYGYNEIYSHLSDLDDFISEYEKMKKI